MAGMTFFGWMTEKFNEHTSVIGIGCVLFLLALAAAWFSRRVTDGGDPADGMEREANTIVTTFAET